MRGNCYVASEALWHALGGRRSAWRPQVMRLPCGERHWFLKHRTLGTIVDPSRRQFKGKLPDYSKARGCGFLTSRPLEAGTRFAYSDDMANQEGMMEQQQTFDAALADFIAEINRVRNKNNERFTNLVQGSSFVEVTGGAKYAGLITGDATGGGRSRYGFVRKSDGAVLYAAGFKAPFIGKTEATTVRGNIYDANTWAGCIGPYGVLTLNRR